LARKAALLSGGGDLGRVQIISDTFEEALSHLLTIGWRAEEFFVGWVADE